YISRFQKIIQVIPRPEEMASGGDNGNPIVEPDPRDRPPEYGYVSGGLGLGSMNREYNIVGSGYAGSGFLVGARGEGQIWITRDFFAELELGYNFFSYSQESLGGGASNDRSFAGNLVRFRLDAGYFYHLSRDILGPKGWIKIGFQSNSYHLPLSAG